MNVGGKETTSSQLGTDPPSTDQEDIYTVIEEVAKDAEAKATKIAAGEAAKSTAEEATKGAAGETGEAAVGEAGKGPAGESGKAAAGEANKAAAEEAAKEPAGEGAADDQPSSRAASALGKYLKVGADLFIRLPGTADTKAPAEGEVFDDEALATAGFQVVDEPSASGGGSQEEQLLPSRERQFPEAAGAPPCSPRQGELQDGSCGQSGSRFPGVRRSDALAATLRGKDEEIGKIVAQRTQELEQKHNDALDALVLDQAGKVEKLELEREGLKKEILELTEERDTVNRTLADLQVAISDKTKLLSEANSSIDDLKLQLGTLEGTLSEVMAREEILNKALESEK
nr:A-kinase anchor protein 5-like [Aegilops tauschii subsp. strangulata]